MQFKHPEILYLLILLIIPILVHLFQLQKFVKTPFTNVAFLQKVVLQSRNSSRLKKWLILSVRILLFTSLIFAFSQPYFSNISAKKNNLFFIYLDNSLSTEAKGKKGILLQVTAQEIAENIFVKENYNFLTNSNFYKNISGRALKEKLFTIKNTAKKLTLNQLLLHIQNETKNKIDTLYKAILISDFQNINNNEFTNVKQPISLLKLKMSSKSNLFIDSVFINNINDSHYYLKIRINNQGEEKKDIPIAIYNKQTLLSKQLFSIDKNSLKTLEIPLQKVVPFLGKISLLFNDAFGFDNHFYFSINTPKKINVLSIGKTQKFLAKIYQKNEFNYTHSGVRKINLNTLIKQQLIILNEIKKIPLSLIENLFSYIKNGGTLVIIPNKDININSYQNLFKKLDLGSVFPKKEDSLKITKIHFKHPFFKNVFTRKITNFQYPQINYFYPTSIKNSSQILFLENNKGYIKEVKQEKATVYWIATSLDIKDSNFKNSPLIVPVFYNFGLQSMQTSKLYYRINQENKISVPVQIKNDKILSFVHINNYFIPLQKIRQNDVTIITKDYPLKAGFYHVLEGKDTIQTIAYNYPKEESNLLFADISKLAKTTKNITITNSVEDFFKKNQKKNKVNWLWKWFLMGAIVSLLLEIFILKFFKS